MTGTEAERAAAATGTAPPGRVRPSAARVVVWWVLDWFDALRGQLAGLLPGGPERYRSGGAAPVVAVPGVYETWRFMVPLMRALHGAGHPVHVVDGLRHNRRPVVDGARMLMDEIERRDLRGVVVVAHSKGGLIGKYAMTRIDPDGRIDRLVAVASPFGGSLLARYGLVPTLRAFRADDPTLAGLVAEVAVNSRITSIAGVFDTLIPNGSELVGATNVVVPVGGHFRILRSPRTAEAVLAAVDGA